MVNHTLIESKLQPALAAGKVLRRPQLAPPAEFRDGAATLALACAPAGYGKSTLLACWMEVLAADGFACGWLTLDPDDDDPARLMRHLIAAFRTADPRLGQHATGELEKRAYGPWILSAMRWLARLKRLRGTAFDPFGYSVERRAERQLIDTYERVIDELLRGLSLDNHELAVEIAAIPEQIRGYGHVKTRHLRTAKAREAELLAAFRMPAARLSAAE